MSILFVPDYSDGNPYQSNLASELDETVTYGRKNARLPVISELLAGEVTVVHFHWLNMDFVGDSYPESAFKLLLFVCRVALIRLLGLPVVWTVHNVTAHDQPYPRVERTVKRWFVTSTCDRIIVHSDTIAETLVDELELPPSIRDQVDVIPHGHYLDNYENECTQREARALLDIPQSETVFLYFGMIRRYKGVLDLVAAFDSASVPGSQLLLAGNPATETLHTELREAILPNDDIQGFFEFIPDDRIQVYMNAADVVVLPYREISTSGSAILAMSFGNALVAPMLGCLPDLLDDDGAILYERKKSSGLRASLELATERDLEAMGTHNRTIVRQYDWDDIAARTRRTYDRAAGNAVDAGEPSTVDSAAS